MMLVLVAVLSTGILGLVSVDEPVEQPNLLNPDQHGQSVQPDLFGEVETNRPNPTVSNSTCYCGENNASLHLLEKANIMQEQIRNKTSILSKIKHRATHSEDAMWASLTLSVLLVLLFVSVLQTRMWQDRSFISYMASQPLRYDQYNRKSEISAKRMLKSRARSLVTYFKKRRVGESSRVGDEPLNMENFLQSRDAVDSSHQVLLESSSSSEDGWDESSGSDEDTVYRINKYTGEWEGGGHHAVSLHNKGQGTVRYRKRSVGTEPLLPVNSSGSSEDEEDGETDALLRR